MTLRTRTLADHRRLIRLCDVPGTVRQYYQQVDAEAELCTPAEPARTLGAAIQRVAGDVLPAGAHADFESALANPRTIISSAQHHAAIAHPYTMGAIALESLHALIAGTRQIGLTCGALPLNNNTFPRGVVLCGIRLPFLSRKYRHMSVLTCPPMNPADFGWSLEKAARSGEIDIETYRAVAGWWSSLTPRISGLQHYWQQISVINQSIYQNGFRLGLDPPVMVPGEAVARELLLLDHALGRDSWLERSLYDPGTRSALLESLDGVRCFWNAKTGRGTYHFWHVDGKARLQPVFPAGESLATPSGQVACALHPEAICSAVQDGALIPASSYTLIRTILQCGLRSFGGPLQYDYLATARSRILLDMRGALTASENSQLTATPDSYYVDIAAHSGIPNGLECLVTPVTEEVLDSLANRELSGLASEAVLWIEREVPDY